MLAITAKVRLLKEEVFSAESICRSLVKTLENVTNDSDFRKDIGIYAVQVPDWKILIDEKRRLVELIRKICTGEMPVPDARQHLRDALAELVVLDKWLQVPKK